MLGVVATNGELFGLNVAKDHINSAVYKEVLGMKVFPWVKITKKSDYVFQQIHYLCRAWTHTTKIVNYWLDASMSFFPKTFDPLSHRILTPST